MSPNTYRTRLEMLADSRCIVVHVRQQCVTLPEELNDKKVALKAR